MENAQISKYLTKFHFLRPQSRKWNPGVLSQSPQDYISALKCSLFLIFLQILPEQTTNIKKTKLCFLPSLKLTEQLLQDMHSRAENISVRFLKSNRKVAYIYFSAP